MSHTYIVSVRNRKNLVYMRYGPVYRHFASAVRRAAALQRRAPHLHFRVKEFAESALDPVAIVELHSPRARAVLHSHGAAR